MLGGLRVWQNSSRTRALERYVAALRTAEAPMNAHLAPGVATGLDEMARKFTRAEVGVKQFKDQSAQWETDFRSAKDQVAVLKAPHGLGIAQDEIVQAIDMYVGVARLYNLAAQTRETADLQPPKGQQQIEDKVQVLIQHAGEWQARAASLLSLGNDMIAAYQRAWHTNGPEVGSAPTPAPS